MSAHLKHDAEYVEGAELERIDEGALWGDVAAVNSHELI